MKATSPAATSTARAMRRIFFMIVWNPCLFYIQVYAREGPKVPQHLRFASGRKGLLIGRQDGFQASRIVPEERRYRPAIAGRTLTLRPLIRPTCEAPRAEPCPTVKVAVK